MTFLELYGTKLDRELGTADRTQRFTTALRKEYVNEGIAKFNERTGCYVKRASIAITDEVAEYDLEASGVLAAGDYLRPSTTGAVIQIVGSSDTRYLEGDAFQFITEEELSVREPGWRSWSPGTPTHWFLRRATGAHVLGLFPAPDVASGETWTVLWPYVAVPPVLTADADEPYSGRVTLVPYHDAVLAYAAAQLEKLRKAVDAVDRQMRTFAAGIVQYQTDQAPPQGSAVRLRANYRTRLRPGGAFVPFGR